MTEKIKITIIVPESVIKAMKEIAEQERRSMTQEMIRAFEEHINKHQQGDEKDS